MTRKEKCQASNILQDAYVELLNLINEGLEYPEAHTRICVEHCLDDFQSKTLSDIYDDD